MPEHMTVVMLVEGLKQTDPAMLAHHRDAPIITKNRPPEPIEATLRIAVQQQEILDLETPKKQFDLTHSNDAQIL